MNVSKEQILQELREMVPLAVEALREMLQNPRTPPAVRKQLIELALKYGVNEKSTLALQDTCEPCARPDVNWTQKVAAKGFSEGLPR